MSTKRLWVQLKESKLIITEELEGGVKERNKEQMSRNNATKFPEQIPDIGARETLSTHQRLDEWEQNWTCLIIEV